jgi:hypothetical protein
LAFPYSGPVDTIGLRRGEGFECRQLDLVHRHPAALDSAGSDMYERE